MLNLGHSRSPLWCGSQSHHRDPRPGYGRLLRDLGAAQTAITLNDASFSTCYGIQFVEQPRNRNTIYSRPMRFDMICKTNGIEDRLTKPNHPWTKRQIERMNCTIKDAAVKRFHC
ncbi:MAG: hypothetical protein ACKVPY_07635 [Paracoccaceae bacterium]